MFEWLKLPRWAQKPDPPLRGAPAKPRMKTYAAQSGFVYHYFFLGVRESLTDLKYAFSISGDRKTWFVNHVVVDWEQLRSWEKEHGRSLAPAERYATAKLILFSAFDTRENPDSLRAPIRASVDEIREGLERLGLD